MTLDMLVPPSPIYGRHDSRLYKGREGNACLCFKIITASMPLFHADINARHLKCRPKVWRKRRAAAVRTACTLLRGEAHLGSIYNSSCELFVALRINIFLARTRISFICSQLLTFIDKIVLKQLETRDISCATKNFRRMHL